MGRIHHVLWMSNLVELAFTHVLYLVMVMAASLRSCLASVILRNLTLRMLVLLAMLSMRHVLRFYQTFLFWAFCLLRILFSKLQGLVNNRVYDIDGSL